MVFVLIYFACGSDHYVQSGIDRISIITAAAFIKHATIDHESAFQSLDAVEGNRSSIKLLNDETIKR